VAGQRICPYIFPNESAIQFLHSNKRDGILQEERWVDVAQNPLVGFDDFLQLHPDEEIERVDVLFDQPFDLEECREKGPFILINVRLCHE